MYKRIDDDFYIAIKVNTQAIEAIELYNNHIDVNKKIRGNSRVTNEILVKRSVFVKVVKDGVTEDIGIFSVEDYDEDGRHTIVIANLLDNYSEYANPVNRKHNTPSYKSKYDALRDCRYCRRGIRSSQDY